MGCADVYWIQLTRDMVRRRGVLDMEADIRFPWREGGS
jgi:hypothetical protein